MKLRPSVWLLLLLEAALGDNYNGRRVLRSAYSRINLGGLLILDQGALLRLQMPLHLVIQAVGHG